MENIKTLTFTKHHARLCSNAQNKFPMIMLTIYDQITRSKIPIVKLPKESINKHKNTKKIKKSWESRAMKAIIINSINQKANKNGI